MKISMTMTATQKLMITMSIVLCTVLIYLLSPILMPFMIAGLFAYLGNPIANNMERFYIPRSIAVIIVFLILFGTIVTAGLFLLPMLWQQLGILLSRLPEVIIWLQKMIPAGLAENFNVHEYINLQTLQSAVANYWKEVGDIALLSWQIISRSGQMLFMGLLNLILIPVVTFYLLRDWNVVLESLRNLLPRSVEPLVVKLFGECNQIVGAFFRGQLIVMLSLGLFYTLGLWFVGLDLALVIGILLGILTIVPYLGVILGVLITTSVTLFQFHDATHLLYVLVVFGLGHVIESMWLTPLLVGNRIGLHPVAVIFAILAGGQLFGFIGILLALPVAASIMVIVRHFKVRYLKSRLYRSAGKTPPNAHQTT